MHAARCGDIDLGWALTRTRQKVQGIPQGAILQVPLGRRHVYALGSRTLEARPDTAVLLAPGQEYTLYFKPDDCLVVLRIPGSALAVELAARDPAPARASRGTREVPLVGGRLSTLAAIQQTLVDATKPTTGNASVPQAKHLEAQLCSSGPRNPPFIRDARACNPAHPHCRRVGRCQPRESDHPWPSVCSGRRWRSLPRVRVPESSRPDANAVRVRPAARVGAAEPSRVQAGRFGDTARARCRIRSSRQVRCPLSKHLRRVTVGNASAQLEPAVKSQGATVQRRSHRHPLGSMSANPPSTGHAGTPGRMNLGT